MDMGVGWNAPTLFASSAWAVIFLYLVWHQSHPRSKTGAVIPPGPTGWPILGSSCVTLHNLSNVSHYVLGCFTYLAKYPEVMLDKWAKKYGPLFSFTIGNQLFVAISDPHIVKDLVITNGATFSSRKDMYMKAQLVFARRGVTATQYNDTWYATHDQVFARQIHDNFPSQEETPPSCGDVLDA